MAKRETKLVEVFTKYRGVKIIYTIEDDWVFAVGTPQMTFRRPTLTVAKATVDKVLDKVKKSAFKRFTAFYEEGAPYAQYVPVTVTSIGEARARYERGGVEVYFSKMVRKYRDGPVVAKADSNSVTGDSNNQFFADTATNRGLVENIADISAAMEKLDEKRRKLEGQLKVIPFDTLKKMLPTADDQS